MPTTGNVKQPSFLTSGKKTNYIFCSDYYFTNLVWADNHNISVTWMDRAQTTSVVMLCNAARGTCIEVRFTVDKRKYLSLYFRVFLVFIFVELSIGFSEWLGKSKCKEIMSAFL